MSGLYGEDTPPPLPGNSPRVQVTAGKQPQSILLKKTGHLRRWFWAPVVQGENSAQTFFRVLGNLSRTLFTLLVLLFGIALAAVLVLDQHYKRDAAERQAALVEREAAKPVNFVSVSLDQTFLDDEKKDFADGCTKEFPFRTLVRNGSTMAMTETRLVFSVRKKGTSEVLLFRGKDFNGGLSERWQDAQDTYSGVIRRIVLPNSDLTYCWRFPPDYFLDFDPTAEYVYKVEVGAATVFREPEDWMYEELGLTRED